MWAILFLDFWPRLISKFVSYKIYTIQIEKVNEANFDFEHFSVATPIVMDYLEKRGTLCRYPWMTLPTTLGLLGFCLTFATPLACAFFKQKASMPYKHLEPQLKVSNVTRWSNLCVYFNGVFILNYATISRVL